jgi:XTP/dITP diphosphohydrolase
MKIIVASHNPGKINEFHTLLANSGIHIIPQSEYGVDEAEETGLTFIENALIKARHASLLTGLPSIADDSGLTVDALMGAPGIYSARFAGEKGNAQACNTKLLQEMHNIPAEKRQARFYCVLVYMRHAKDPTPLITHGIWEGKILEHVQGTGGFGYDPLFFDPILKKTAAELSSHEKNLVSHRGKAMHELTHLLRETRHVSA